MTSLRVITAIVAFSAGEGLWIDGCQLLTRLRQRTQTESNLSPQAPGGRALRVVTEDYVLYASDQDAAAGLERWVDAELALFRSQHNGTPIGKGIIFAIESAEDPVSPVEQWHKRNVDRSRSIVWSSPIRSQFVSTSAGRPYSIGFDAYFRESFVIPLKEARGIGLLDGIAVEPNWLCFLTTDEYMRTAFWDERRRCRQDSRRSAARVPIAVRILSAPAVLMYRCVTPFIHRKCLAVDTKLMHLQRREILWGSLIRATVQEEARQSKELARLQSEIDQAWKSIWVRRPMD